MGFPIFALDPTDVICYPSVAMMIPSHMMPSQRSLFRLGMVLASFFLGSFMLLAESLPPIRLNSEQATYLSGNDAIRNVSVQPERWTWQLHPDGFIYPTYLAAMQNRLGGAWNHDKDINWIWDVTLGGRAPLVRYGNKSAIFPEGWQLDMEGSVALRLHLNEGMDMEANDFRFGFPVSYGNRLWQFRTGYCHVSSHMGDERILRLPDYESNGVDPERLNYYRETWLVSFAYRPTPDTRLYAEVDYAFMLGEWTKPWHFQFGAEYSPVYPTRGRWGTPFAAINARLMQEHDYDGNLTIQTGWQWRGRSNQLFRIGFQYFGGVSDQYEFIADGREHKIGLGVWYDF